MTSLAPAIVRMLRGKKFHYDSEKELQDGIESVLRQEGFAHEREKNLGEAGFIDFLVGDTGLEVKTQGNPIDVARQLLRYLERPEVGDLILVTGKHRLGCLPGELLGKRITVVSLWRSFL